MSNLRIVFAHSPWFLLFLIPTIILVLLPYFRLSKKYRRTRNRIISMILNLLMVILTVSVLAGITFAYEKPNTENEVIILVDLSDSNEKKDEQKNEFIKSLLKESKSIFSIGIVTFGLDQVYAAPLSYDVNQVYYEYINADRPDGSATNIAEALLFAQNCFNKPETGKIVLLSDGFETDFAAANVIMTLVSKGIRVDTVHFPDEYSDEVQIAGIEMPDYNPIVDKSVKIGAIIKSSYAGLVTLKVSDNDEEVKEITVAVSQGEGVYYFDHTFTTTGLHKITCNIQSENDSIDKNNSYCSFINLQVFDKVLIVEREANQAQLISNMLENNFDVTVKKFADADFPKTAQALSEYDQVILVNIAFADMPAEFENELYRYVYEIGGGLFTVGGSKTVNGNLVANTYNRIDMSRSNYYADMLPVECIDYSPPIAVMLVLDRSTSMTYKDAATGRTRMDLAKEGAAAVVNALNDRDYVGVISFSSGEPPRMEAPLTSVPQKQKVLSAIANIEPYGGTIYTSAIEMAGSALQSFTGVEKKHIIFVTDGAPNDTPQQYEPPLEIYAEAGITVSVISIYGPDYGGAEVGERMAQIGNGRSHIVTDISTLPLIMREEVRQPEIKDYIPEEFTPRIRGTAQPTSGLTDMSIVMPLLGGYYGVKAKGETETSLMGEYTPIYTQWKYGKGRVGSFMSDLNGVWSAEFMTNEYGIKFINNVVKGLFPSESIRAKEINISIKPNNFKPLIRIDTFLNEGDTLEVLITDPQQNVTTLTSPESSGGFLRYTFDVSESGLYEIKIIKKDASEAVLSEYLTNFAFSYSAEYNVFSEGETFLPQEKGAEFLKALAVRGKGSFVPVSDASIVFDTYKKTIDVKKQPWATFMIAAILLLLLDVAVRKFKFKWPWEIVKDKQAQKALMQQNTSKSVS